MAEMAGSDEHGTGPLLCIKSKEFLDLLSDYQL
jgi:hypothetical protein